MARNNIIYAASTLCAERNSKDYTVSLRFLVSFNFATGRLKAAHRRIFGGRIIDNLQIDNLQMNYCGRSGRVTKTKLRITIAASGAQSVAFHAFKGTQERNISEIILKCFQDEISIYQ